ncbi:MAG: lipoprotein [Gammaproteobacteria bacterium]|nr:lipoprotein [Gammaproteobacteria bacterium]
MTKRSFALLTCLCLLAALAGCGNKGPLELPQEETEKRARGAN